MCYILKSIINMSLSTGNVFLKGKWVHTAVALRNELTFLVKIKTLCFETSCAKSKTYKI